MSISKWGDIVAIVHYRIQNCSGTIRFIIDSSFAIDNGNHLDTFSLFHYDINSFKNLLELTLMQKVGKMVGVTIPPCNSGTTATNIQFYTAACGVWLKCSYMVDTTKVICDIGMTGPKQHYFDNSSIWIDHYRWHPCGQTCCIKTYKICISPPTPPFSGNIVKITQLTRNRSGDCTLQSQFKNWRDTTQTVPCGDDC
jgi:hypothetical protein